MNDSEGRKTSKYGRREGGKMVYTKKLMGRSMDKNEMEKKK